MALRILAFQLRPSVTFVDHTVDQEKKKLCGIEFSQFILAVDSYNMDERLEHS